MNIPFEIVKIHILIRNGRADLVTLYTNLPSPMMAVDTEDMSMSFTTAAGEGEDYVSTHFPSLIPVEVVKVKHNTHKFSGT